MTDIDRLVAKMDRITEKVNHASYGYSGFFDIVKIKEENLDRMIAFDNQLLDSVNTLTDEHRRPQSAAASGETTQTSKTKFKA